MRSSGCCSEDGGVSAAVAGCIDVLCIIDVSGSPVDFLYFFKGFNVPKLELVLSSIASS